jgi:hypothetical protein
VWHTATYLPCPHLEVWCWVAGADVRLPVVEAEVAVLRHEALAALKVGLHVGVDLQPVHVINVAADLSTANIMQQCRGRKWSGTKHACRDHPHGTQ